MEHFCRGAPRGGACGKCGRSFSWLFWLLTYGGDHKPRVVADILLILLQHAVGHSRVGLLLCELLHIISIYADIINYCGVHSVCKHLIE